MASEDIRLSTQELDDLKDEIKFRTTMTMDMKYLKGKIKKIDDIENDVDSLKIHRSIHWALISFVVVSIIGLAFWKLKVLGG